MMSLPAMPTHLVRNMAYLIKPAQCTQVAKYDNLNPCESLSFSGDIESLEPSKLYPYRLLIARAIADKPANRPDEPTSKSVKRHSINNR